FGFSSTLDLLSAPKSAVDKSKAEWAFGSGANGPPRNEKGDVGGTLAGGDSMLLKEFAGRCGITSGYDGAAARADKNDPYAGTSSPMDSSNACLYNRRVGPRTDRPG